MSSTDPAARHIDLAGYVLGNLEPDEQRGFEDHLADCSSCQAELAVGRRVAVLLAAATPAYVLPPELEARTLERVERAAVEAEGAPRPVAPERDGSAAAPGPAARVRDDEAPRRSWWRTRLGPVRLGPALGVAALVAVAVLAGARVGARQPGDLELSATLASPRGLPMTANARVSETGIGRVIDFRSDDLAILPKGQFYELWFVGPGDRPGRPNRISAGTFHPDAQGRSQLRMTAAVDPTLFPVLSVSREVGPSDLTPGPEVLRSRPAG